MYSFYKNENIAKITNYLRFSSRQTVIELILIGYENLHISFKIYLLEQQREKENLIKQFRRSD